jgi:phage-related protein
MILWGMHCTLQEAIMRRLAGIGAVIMLYAVTGTAWAMHPLVTDDPGTQGKGAVLVESNISYLKDNEFRSTVVPIALTVGISETMDAGVESPYLFLRPSAATGNPESGFSDVNVKFKHRIYEREKKNGEHEQSERSLAYQVAYSQPSGSEEKGLGAGTARWSVRLMGTTEGESTEVSANLGYDSSGKALRRGNFFFDYAASLSVAAKYERPKPWEPVVELSVVRVKGGDGYERLASALAGIIYEPSDQYYVDAGIRIGLNERSEDYALLAGFGYKF